MVQPWQPQDIGNAIPTVPWQMLISADTQGADQHTMEALQHLRRWGFVRIRGVPPTVDATSELATQLGVIQPTFYGTIWDTAPRELADVIDTVGLSPGPHNLFLCCSH